MVACSFVEVGPAPRLTIHPSPLHISLPAVVLSGLRKSLPRDADSAPHLHPTFSCCPYSPLTWPSSWTSLICSVRSRPPPLPVSLIATSSSLRVFLTAIRLDYLHPILALFAPAPCCVCAAWSRASPSAPASTLSLFPLAPSAICTTTALPVAAPTILALSVCLDCSTSSASASPVVSYMPFLHSLVCLPSPPRSLVIPLVREATVKLARPVVPNPDRRLKHEICQG